MIEVNDLVIVMTGRCEDTDLCEWIEQHDFPIIKITTVEDDNIWGEVFETGEQVPYHMEYKDVEFYGKYKDTVKHYLEVLTKYPLHTIISVEDMNGNAIFPSAEFAEHIDCDTPMAELLLPIYIDSNTPIEQGQEDKVFIYTHDRFDRTVKEVLEDE